MASFNWSQSREIQTRFEYTNRLVAGKAAACSVGSDSSLFSQWDELYFAALRAVTVSFRVLSSRSFTIAVKGLVAYEA